MSLEIKQAAGGAAIIGFIGTASIIVNSIVLGFGGHIFAQLGPPSQLAVEAAVGVVGIGGLGVGSLLYGLSQAREAWKQYQASKTPSDL